VNPVIAQVLHIVPNPTSGEVSLNLPTGGAYEISVMSMEGSTLIHSDARGDEGQRLFLSLQEYNQGVYIIRLRQAGVTYLARVVRL
jgi:hypothetical protein